jgi:hypothetical protein
VAVVNTGTGGGSLSGLQISPAPGSVFIPRNTVFRLAWLDNTTPPDRFEVRLFRYQEETEDTVRQIDAQATTLRRVGDSYIWDFHRADDRLLHRGAVYFVSVTAGDNEVRATYIASNDDRSQPDTRTIPGAPPSIGVR